MKNTFLALFVTISIVLLPTTSLIGQKRPEPSPTKSSLVPRDITVRVTVKGSGTEQVSTRETVSWNIDRTYIASTVLNKALPFSDVPPTTLAWLGQLTKEIFLDDKSKQGMYFYFDQSVVPSDDKYIHTRVVVNDTTTRRILIGTDKEGNPKYQTNLDTVHCDFIADTLRLANVRIDNSKGFIGIRFPLGADTRTFRPVCTQTRSVKGKLTPPDPPDEESPVYTAPPIPSTTKFPSLVAIDIPVGTRSFDDSIEFETGELEAIMPTIYGVKPKITVSASYKFVPSK